jgi:hypothetical protein
MRMPKLATLILGGTLLAGGCADENASDAPAKKSGKSGRRASAASASGGSNPESDLRRALLANPTSCEAGENKRQVLSVKVTDREQSESGGSKYKKVRGEATISESGPCEESKGKHRWKAGITYVEDDGDWRLASFGFDQKRVD